MSGLLHPAETFAVLKNAKVTLPSIPVTDPRFVYIHSTATDIRRHHPQPALFTLRQPI